MKKTIAKEPAPVKPDPAPQKPLERLLDESEVLEILGISRTGLWRYKDEFPPAIWIAGRKKWRQEDVRAYINDPARSVRPD